MRADQSVKSPLEETMTLSAKLASLFLAPAAVIGLIVVGYTLVTFWTNLTGR
jgi:hypothetical protein